MPRVGARGFAAGAERVATGAAVGTGARGALDTGAAGVGAGAGADVAGAGATGACGTGSGRGPCETGAGAGSGACAWPVVGATANTAPTHTHGTQRAAFL